jgi:hypothetical protein
MGDITLVECGPYDGQFKILKNNNQYVVYWNDSNLNSDKGRVIFTTKTIDESYKIIKSIFETVSPITEEVYI